jgi:ribosomal protein S6--L-glutamate ligase
MKILILSRANFLYSTQSLFMAAKKDGHFAEIIDYSLINSIIDKGRPTLYFQDDRLDDIDAVIGRIGPTFTPMGAALLQQFEQLGVYVSPRADALLLARDKWRAQCALVAAGVPMPKAAMINDLEQLDELAERLGGYPLIIKLLESTHGSGVILVRERKGARSTLDAFAGLHKGVLVQQYIAESNGEDIRAIVCGNKVVAAMKRTPPPGEFRSNLHRGGTAQLVELSKQETEVAILAAQTVGLDIAGVDILRSHRGPLVMEVNASPGLEGIEGATGMSVSAEMMKQLVKGARNR